METTKVAFWWLKSTPTNVPHENGNANLVVPHLDLHSGSLLELDQDNNGDTDIDVGSIIEEINRVAAKSPLGPYERPGKERDVEDLMREAEKIYLESSKSFEQLSQRSRTSQNITDLLSNISKDSTPTPKSVSPLPTDPNPGTDSNSDEYTQDFSEESKINSPSPIRQDIPPIGEQIKVSASEDNLTTADKSLSMSISKSKSFGSFRESLTYKSFHEMSKKEQVVGEKLEAHKEADEDYEKKVKSLNELIDVKDNSIRTLQEDNKFLKLDIENIKLELRKTKLFLEQTKGALTTKSISSPEINLELEKALERLKDSKEVNTALQLQLDTVNKSHQLLKSSYDDLINNNKNLERKLVELDSSLDRYKNELLSLQKTKDKLLENEINLNKLLEVEKLQGKSLKLQNEKDSKCIQDLNRQIKEMERIIARKHPDSVSALIVAAKENATDTNLTARKVLEDRIKSLEQEQIARETQSSKVFLEIQEKFNQMKAKYENHIDDLELHVTDLKNQLKRKTDTYDVYTQTAISTEGYAAPQKETFTVFTQTDFILNKPKSIAIRKPLGENFKEDAHLIATIKGLQADLTNKERTIVKLQKEIDDSKKTNKKLQKEREGSLKNLNERKEFRSYPEKLSNLSSSRSSSENLRREEELQQIKAERDKLTQQLRRLEEDYHALKTKRIQDLTALQEAHEREVSNYMASITPLKEQLEIQQLSITNLQSQLTTAREELAVLTVEKDHLTDRLMNHVPFVAPDGDGKEDVECLLKKIAFLEKRYEEREYRLKAIVQSLAQKCVTNKSCEQCADRQRQLIAYKVELDQLLATVRALQ